MNDELDKMINDLIIIERPKPQIVNKCSRRKRTGRDSEYAIWKREHDAKLQKKYEQEKWKKLAEEQRKKEAEHRRKRGRYLRPIED
jgi:hypothetical protein